MDDQALGALAIIVVLALLFFSATVFMLIEIIKDFFD